MPKIPRDISARELCEALKKYNYEISRQTGSHIRLTRNVKGSRHSITVPAHNPIKVGTLNHILSELTGHLKVEKEYLIFTLFGCNR
ncbi:MAG: type II toxin-antitoxin system HicA family toxin [Candidatus Wallbacteria bacterium]|nr:type II toxin-antitoxin system HicA family toxin [Candidatus Wallbacteria bacterium]